MSEKTIEVEFAKAARAHLGVEEGDYYYDEYQSGIDHDDLESQSEFAERFFRSGYEIGQAPLRKRLVEAEAALKEIDERDQYDEEQEMGQIARRYFATHKPLEGE